MSAPLTRTAWQEARNAAFKADDHETLVELDANPPAPVPFNYERQQIEQLGQSERYQLKITSDSGATKWLGIDQSKLDRIAETLTSPPDLPPLGGYKEDVAQPADLIGRRVSFILANGLCVRYVEVTRCPDIYYRETRLRYQLSPGPTHGESAVPLSAIAHLHVHHPHPIPPPASDQDEE